MLTGKTSGSSPSLNDGERENLLAELAGHEAAIERLEEQGNFNTWHHDAAKRIRAALKTSEVKDDELD